MRLGFRALLGEAAVVVVVEAVVDGGKRMGEEDED